MSKDTSLKLVVTTARGLEDFLAQELDSMGLTYEVPLLPNSDPEKKPKKQAGVFELARDKASAYRICLWSRIAQRVLWELNSFDATSSDDLYETLVNFPWTRHLSNEQTFKVDVNTSSNINDNAQFLTYKVKDAIVDSFTEKGLERPNVSTRTPDVSFLVFWDGEKARCYIDLSGSPLHKRGYRKESGEAPIRETLAASMLYACGWDKQTSGQFIDPFCGSGTILIEAALMAHKIAPGLLRQRFGFERWKQHDDNIWQQIRKDALNARTDGSNTDNTNKSNFVFKGYDADAEVLKTAKQNTTFATLGNIIHFERRSIAQFNARAINQNMSNGFIVTNPPYGERIGISTDKRRDAHGNGKDSRSHSNKNPWDKAKKKISGADVKAELLSFHEARKLQQDKQRAIQQEKDAKETMKLFYRTIGQKFKQTIAGWHVAVISDHIEKVDAMGLNVELTHKVFNGSIQCFLRAGVVKPLEQQRPLFLPERPNDLPKPRKPRGRKVEEQEEPPAIAEDFINRLYKNLKARKKLVNSLVTDSFRLYDADMPEYNVAIDWYQGHWHVQEYAPPKSIDENKARERLDLVLNSLQHAFRTNKNRIHLKTRQKQKGKSQYTKNDDSGRWLTVTEHGVQAQVNLTDYLDTGLFLDHRPTRFALQDLCVNKRFLNLFCYTGVATMHAAMGNENGCAKSSISVDTSNTYLDWARRNLAVNGLSETDHRFVRHDCIEWLRRTREQFDVIFLDPPTFSNSKSRENVFDVQRDHPELIELAMKRLEPDGLLIFSTNAKKFKLGDDVSEQWQCEEMTSKTIPLDFKANHKPPIHQCWYIRYKQESN